MVDTAVGANVMVYLDRSVPPAQAQALDTDHFALLAACCMVKSCGTPLAGPAPLAGQ